MAEVCQVLDEIPAPRKGLGGAVVKELNTSQWSAALEPSQRNNHPPLTELHRPISKGVFFPLVPVVDALPGSVLSDRELFLTDLTRSKLWL